MDGQKIAEMMLGFLIDEFRELVEIGSGGRFWADKGALRAEISRGETHGYALQVGHIYLRRLSSTNFHQVLQAFVEARSVLQYPSSSEIPLWGRLFESSLKDAEKRRSMLLLLAISRLGQTFTGFEGYAREIESLKGATRPEYLLWSQLTANAQKAKQTFDNIVRVSDLDEVVVALRNVLKMDPKDRKRRLFTFLNSPLLTLLILGDGSLTVLVFEVKSVKYAKLGEI